MFKISTIIGREILDSRGFPTIEIDVTFSDGTTGRGMVPSGASTGSHEAHEKRDTDNPRFGGKGVIGTLNELSEIRETLIGKEFNQQTLDKKLCELDGTEQKKRLGANLILGISLAFAYAAAKSQNIPVWQYCNNLLGTKKPSLPTPLINVLNGGAHAKEGLDIQEIMIAPRGQKTFAEKLRAGSEIFHALKKLATQANYSTTVGDEGGLALPLAKPEDAFELLKIAIANAGYTTETIGFALDVAASELHTDETNYFFKKENKNYTSIELIARYKNWCENYPMVSIEDGLAEDDWSSWTTLTKELGEKIKIVGDDLFTTNPIRLTRGIEEKSANAILIKLNQIGTLIETIETIQKAQENNFTVIISHRSGETEDTFIAHLAVGVGAEYIKTGSVCRSERVAKYNELLRIAEILETK